MSSKRVAITLQAVRGDDDPIIEWWESLHGNPQRSAHLRHAILSGIGMPIHPPAPVQQDPLLITTIENRVRRELDDMEISIQQNLPAMIRSITREIVLEVLGGIQSAGTIAAEQTFIDDNQEFLDNMIKQDW